ncbi:hypothetical protein [Tenuifilum thalassicum]|uniref:Uncharacterized protein n=1 Tax=Tenuifilum thalassicum TaxID=2590900 RepID=A0A7D4BYF6_9BACT|nr:hypothetical protein [Tenuifilum thalassicum]QKG79064.1 hypothetical protein FHG85_01885 [Tenuifilum thalassicum]
MKRTNLILAASIMMMAAISFTSCEKDDEVINPIVEQSVEDDDVDSYFDDVLAEVDDITLSENSKDSQMAYATLGENGERIRKTSWDDNNCRIDSVIYNEFVNPNAKYERVKNGVIIIRTCGNYLSDNFERTVTFDNFTINGNKIEGKKVIRKTAEHQYQITLTDGKVTFTDGTTYTRNAERTRTWVEGYDTPFFVWDDVYTLEGSATGVNRKGETYTHQITSALMFKLNCRWIVQGVINITVGDKEATLDYGMGECDNMAYVTVNGKTYEIKLRGGK